ncbi:DUF742 domain-containing protein [Micromonospora sp. BQ11]|uniref:DUF742 domain-containing protein n=1 Tax=Micromonospora sp. BQ11 TaxID=3452212 RepID=UPI003F894AA9
MAAGHNADPAPVEDDPGPVVRPYAVTRGRARPVTGRFDLVSLIRTIQRPDDQRHGLAPEHLSILTLCRGAMSVAEVSAYLDLPLGTVRVLLGDLLVRELVEVWEPAPRLITHDHRTLEDVLNGLRAL